MVRLWKAIPLCFLLVPGCSGDAGRINGPLTDPAFNHVPGEPVGLPSVGVRVDGSMARIIWHEDPFNLGAGYTVELYAGDACSGTNLLPDATNVAGTAWTETYHLYMEYGPLAVGPYCTRVRSDGQYSPPVFQAFVSARFSIGSANSPPESAFTWLPASPLEGDVITFTGVASDPDGDDLSFAWTFDGVAVSTSASFDQVFGDDGTHEVMLTVSDGRGGSSSSTQALTIANAPPVLLGAAAAKTSTAADALTAVPIGEPVEFSGTFSDPGLLDTHALTIDCDYGGTTLDGTNASAVLPDYSGSCTWESPGIHRALITITDDDGGSASRISEPVLVYETIAGLDVTGGGWIDSPAGACQVDPACAGSTGRATFGFVSEYRKASAVPTGSTVFQFHAASLTFKSGPQLWLVVDGPVARFTGSGELDGTEGFDFSVTAVDGRADREPDRFRIRIWQHVSGEVVYDSAPGADPAGDAAAPIRGGSIVVHGRD